VKAIKVVQTGDVECILMQISTHACSRDISVGWFGWKLISRCSCSIQ